MDKDERLEGHQKFKELAALARPGALSDNERQELSRHLRVCASCQEAYAEYSLIDAKGMPFLAAVYGQNGETEGWDDAPARARLLASVRGDSQAEQRFGSAVKSGKVIRMGRRFLPSRAAQWAVAAAAACLLFAVAMGAYHLGGRTRVAHQQIPLPSTSQQHDLVSDKKAADDLRALQTADMSRLQLQISSGQQEIARLRDALHAAESRSSALSATSADRDKEFRELSEQRDKLASQLHDAELAYQLVQAELTTLRTEHERVQLRATSLESRVDELTASSREQERRLKDDEQYLSSDRDIRELMGARKLYIADVFDVDSGSRTRKPFGRVFYTQSKSLDLLCLRPRSRTRRQECQRLPGLGTKRCRGRREEPRHEPRNSLHG